MPPIGFDLQWDDPWFTKGAGDFVDTDMKITVIRSDTGQRAFRDIDLDNIQSQDPREWFLLPNFTGQANFDIVISYNAANSANAPNASSQAYDFGDDPAEPAEGYGSMQVHNHDAKQTLFAINHWQAGQRADLGLGNQPGQPGKQPDWTFAGNASFYATKRLRILVHCR